MALLKKQQVFYSFLCNLIFTNPRYYYLIQEICINPLVLGCDPSIPNSKPRHVDLEIRNLVHVMDPFAYGWHPFSCVRLSEGKKWIHLVLWEEGEELDEERVEVVRDLRLGGRKALWLGETVAGPDWVVNVHHVGTPVPRVRVEATCCFASGAVFKDGADWPVDFKDAEEG